MMITLVTLPYIISASVVRLSLAPYSSGAVLYLSAASSFIFILEQVFLSLPFSSVWRVRSTMSGVELLFGPMLIGVALNLMLYGAVVTQTCAYFQRYPNDLAWIRSLMVYLLIVETVNVVVELGIIYQPLIIQYGTAAAVTISPRHSVLISIVSAPIQLFAAWRINVITKSLWLPAFIALLSLGSFASGITVSVKVAMNAAFRDFDNFSVEVILWLALSAFCDLVIAVSMSYALVSCRFSIPQVSRSAKLISNLYMTLETGALTALTAIIDVLLFLLFPRASVNFIVDFPLSNLYTCSMLAMLNSRDDRRKRADPEGSGTNVMMLSQHHMMPHSRSMSNHVAPFPQVEIYMKTSTEKMVSPDHNSIDSWLAPDRATTLVPQLNPAHPVPTANSADSQSRRPDTARTMVIAAAEYPTSERTKPSSHARSHSVPGNDNLNQIPRPDSSTLPTSEPTRYNYNYNGPETSKPQTRSSSHGAVGQRRPLPSNPRPKTPDAVHSQLALRPRTIISPESKWMPEKF
ncbi:hypothetical protein R3P38DRAFT_3123411 [Favolaschia claudopus]|uniref:DUF6534 domain-containing protein n=1 Tax=Favolaschia claudopus TaxID=2862362 RepID=A0AAV9ZCG3_9AGAR